MFAFNNKCVKFTQIQSSNNETFLCDFFLSILLRSNHFSTLFIRVFQKQKKCYIVQKKICVYSQNTAWNPRSILLFTTFRKKMLIAFLAQSVKSGMMSLETNICSFSFLFSNHFKYSQLFVS